MSNMCAYSGRVASMLEEMRAHRKELDDAIKAMEKLAKREEATPNKSVSQSIEILAKDYPNYSEKSIYEATIDILTRYGKTLTTDEVVDSLKKGGKNIARNIVSVTLYKAVRDKKDCKIARAGTGKWKLA